MELMLLDVNCCRVLVYYLRTLRLAFDGKVEVGEAVFACRYAIRSGSGEGREILRKCGSIS